MKLLRSANLTRSCVQLASGGAWETAVDVTACTDEWVVKAGENIAIETVYTGPSDELVGFVGFRKIVPDPTKRGAFWRKVTSPTLSQRQDMPLVQISSWLEMLALPSPLGTSSQSIEFGVFNQWRSAGTIRQTTKQLVLPKDPNAPSWLRKGADRPICKEYVWDIGDGFWIADNVSIQTDRKYYLCAELIVTARFGPSASPRDQIL